MLTVPTNAENEINLKEALKFMNKYYRSVSLQ